SRKRLVWTLACAGLAGAGAASWNWFSKPAAPAYTVVTVRRGNLAATISATGKVQAVTTVQVGTQVSGTVSELHADFNDHVEAGVTPARQLETSEAAKAQAAAEKAQADAQYNQTVAQAQASKSQLDQALAQATQSKASVDVAAVNLERTIIRAPIDGVVVSRNVDVGQTVAASLQAPTLFLIAQDLTKMQVLADVDEADVGQLSPESKVSFTVDAF